MDNRRTETARDHDDRDVIDRTGDAPDETGRSGGDLQRDAGTANEEARVEKPGTHGRVTKDADIRNDAAYRSDRARD